MVLAFLALDVLWVLAVLVFICHFSMRVGEARFDSSAKLADWLRMEVSPWLSLVVKGLHSPPSDLGHRAVGIAHPAYCSAKIQKRKF